MPRAATLAAAGAAVLLLVYLGRRGVTQAATDAGAAVVNAAGGAAAGAVGAVGAAVGLPTPAETTTDAQVARWIIDHHGYMTASMWSGAPALFRALSLPEGSGRPPPPGSPAALALGVQLPTSGDFARMDRAMDDSTPRAWVPDDPWRLGAPGWDNAP